MKQIIIITADGIHIVNKAKQFVRENKNATHVMLPYMGVDKSGMIDPKRENLGYIVEIGLEDFYPTINEFK
jgi:hypothetical protein